MKSSGTSDRFAEYQKQLRMAMRALLPARGLSLTSDDGRVRWVDRYVAVTSVLLSWSSASVLHEAFAQAREVLVSMYPTRLRPGAELSGFLRAWLRRSAELVQRVTSALRRHTQQLAGDAFRWKGWTVMGVDGSRINAPRTRANETGLGCAGKVRTAPQLLLVTLFHVATGLPWAWRRDRGDGSERDLLQNLLDTLPEKTLLLADAGFVGYAMLGALQAAGHAFVIRVGRHVRLLRKLKFEVEERRGTVYLWPEGRRRERPLVLRLVEFETDGRRVSLLTNVRDEAVLSDAEVLSLYRQRWTIEVMYRSLKQTMGKRTLRAETPETARCELDWAMVGLWMLGLMAQTAAAPRANATRASALQAWSPAGALRVVRTAMRNPRRRAGRRCLARQLRAARRDTYVRAGSKTARNWPHKKREKPPGRPQIRTATKAEVAQAKEIKLKYEAA